MTDKDKLIALLTDFGVEFELNGKEVICERGMKKVSGYSGFYTCFSFDDDGNFLEMGAWE